VCVCVYLCMCNTVLYWHAQSLPSKPTGIFLLSSRGSHVSVQKGNFSE